MSLNNVHYVQKVVCLDQETYWQQPLPIRSQTAEVVTHYEQTCDIVRFHRTLEILGITVWNHCGRNFMFMLFVSFDCDLISVTLLRS